MSRFVEGEQRSQLSLLPASLDECVDAENPVRVVDVFIEELDLAALGFSGLAATGRPGYHPATLLKIYLYGYRNRIQSSRRLEREANRNVELMWLTGRLAPDFKTIADFRRDNGTAIQSICARFIAICSEPRFRSPILMLALWPPTCAAPASLATTCKPLSTPNTISSSHMQ